MWTILRHANGRDFLSLGNASNPTDSGTCAVSLALDNHASGRMLMSPEMDQDTAQSVPENISGPLRATFTLRRLAWSDPDSDTVLGFGYEAWGEGLPLESFIRSYDTHPNMLRGQRYIIQNLEGKPLSHVNTLRFRPQLTGLAWLATHPEYRRLGHASLILRAVMALARLERPNMKFVLFSEIDPAYYARFGFTKLADSAQHFAASVAMGAARSPFTPDELSVMRHYF
jgi:GNAT superfamily N-acetyltransferase